MGVDSLSKARSLINSYNPQVYNPDFARNLIHLVETCYKDKFTGLTRDESITFSQALSKYQGSPSTLEKVQVIQERLLLNLRTETNYTKTIIGLLSSKYDYFEHLPLNQKIRVFEMCSSKLQEPQLFEQFMRYLASSIQTIGMDVFSNESEENSLATLLIHSCRTSEQLGWMEISLKAVIENNKDLKRINLISRHLEAVVFTPYCKTILLAFFELVKKERFLKYLDSSKTLNSDVCEALRALASLKPIAAKVSLAKPLEALRKNCFRYYLKMRLFLLLEEKNTLRIPAALGMRENSQSFLEDIDFWVDIYTPYMEFLLEEWIQAKPLGPEEWHFFDRLRESNFEKVSKKRVDFLQGRVNEHLKKYDLIKGRITHLIRQYSEGRSLVSAMSHAPVLETYQALLWLPAEIKDAFIASFEREIESGNPSLFIVAHSAIAVYVILNAGSEKAHLSFLISPIPQYRSISEILQGFSNVLAILNEIDPQRNISFVLVNRFILHLNDFRPSLHLLRSLRSIEHTLNEPLVLDLLRGKRNQVLHALNINELSQTTAELEMESNFDYVADLSDLFSMNLDFWISQQNDWGPSQFPFISKVIALTALPGISPSLLNYIQTEFFPIVYGRVPLKVCREGLVFEEIKKTLIEKRDVPFQEKGDLFEKLVDYYLNFNFQEMDDLEYAEFFLNLDPMKNKAINHGMMNLAIKMNHLKYVMISEMRPSRVLFILRNTQSNQIFDLLPLETKIYAICQMDERESSFTVIKLVESLFKYPKKDLFIAFGNTSIATHAISLFANHSVFERKISEYLLNSLIYHEAGANLILNISKHLVEIKTIALQFPLKSTCLFNYRDKVIGMMGNLLNSPYRRQFFEAVLNTL